MLGVHELVGRGARHSVALRDGGGCLTYEELAERSGVAARGLWNLGVRPGDRVVLRLVGGRDFAVLLFGALRMGAVAVPVNPATGPLHLRWMLHDAAPALVVSETEHHPHEVLSRGERLASDPWPRPSAGDLALLMYTSGSTRMPHAVACPRERVRFVVEAIAARLRYGPGDVVLSRIPMSFDYGLYQLFLCARAGATLVLRPDLSETAVLREVRSLGATVLPIVPTLADIVLRLASTSATAPTVRLVTSTGATLTTGQTDGLRRVFPTARIVPMYGMTECKRITIAEPDEDLAFPGTVGRPLDDTEVTVVDDTGLPVPTGVTGEIVVRGPHVMRGYWQAPEATAGRFDLSPGSRSALRTGDLGYLDEGGRLYFVGRRDDIFKRRGVRVSAREIEAALLDVPGVSAAVVLPPTSDEALTAFVVTALPAEDIRAAVALRVDPVRVPDRCVPLPTLPTTANGKVDRAALRDLVTVSVD